MFVGLFRGIDQLIHQPITVLWFCLAFIFVNLVADGTWLRLWSLHRDHAQISAKSASLKNDLFHVEGRIKAAKDPDFLEREARDRFDLVGEGDLVFVFTEDE